MVGVLVYFRVFVFNAFSMIDRKRAASDDEGEPYPKRRYNDYGGHRYEVRLLVQSQVRNTCQLSSHSISSFMRI